MRKYNEIMEKLEVTPEMYARIMKNVETADLSKSNIVRFPGHSLKKYGSLAACFVLLLLGGLFLPRLLQTDVPKEPETTTAWGAAVYATQAELEAVVGFPVPELSSSLPFTPQNVQYAAYENGMAEVVYTGADQETACLRKSRGAEDNSGDYNTYGDIKTLTVNGVSVTLKGENGRYTLAVWQKNGFSYSLSLSNGIAAEAWPALLAKLE